MQLLTTLVAVSDKLRNVHRQFCTNRRLWCGRCKASARMPPAHQHRQQCAMVNHDMCNIHFTLFRNEYMNK